MIVYKLKMFCVTSTDVHSIQNVAWYEMFEHRSLIKIKKIIMQ